MTDPDIIHQDEYCTVYKPGSGKGVLVTTYVPKEYEESVDQFGLMSNREALKRGLTKRDRPYLNDVVFFRPSDTCVKNTDSICYQLRVDPNNTIVFDQEYHASHNTTRGEPNILLSQYISYFEKRDKYDYIMWYNMFEPEFKKYPMAQQDLNNLKAYNAHRLFEVRLKKDIVPMDFFELKNGKPIENSIEPKYGGTLYKYKGRNYKINIGPKGGKYIMVKKAKIYI